jgi:hypothetical protein
MAVMHDLSSPEPGARACLLRDVSSGHRRADADVGRCPLRQGRRPEAELHAGHGCR